MTKELKNDVPAIITKAEKELTAALAKENIKIADIEALTKATKDIVVIDNESLELAKAEKRKFAKFRNDGIKVYKSAREGFNAASKWVIGEEKKYTEIVAEGEDPIGEKISKYEAILKAEQDAIEEAQRVEFVNRINQLTELGAMEDAHTKEMFLDTVRWSKHEIETAEIESFWEILNEFKVKNGELATEEENKLKKQQLHNTRLNELQPYWAFLSEETTTCNLADLSDDSFVAALTIGIAEKAEFDKQKAAIEAQKAEILEQKKIIRKDYLISKGFTVGDVAILGYGKQYPLTILDYTICSDESFENNKGIFQDIINEFKSEQQKIAENQLEHQSRCGKLIELGFKNCGNTLVYENSITVSKTVMDMQEYFDTYLLDCKRLIQEYKDKEIALKKQAYEESENALSDEDKYNRFINAIFDVEKPILKSKKYANKLDDAYKLIEQIKNI